MKKELTKSLVVCLGLIWAATATATVGPPVKVRLMGEPRGVVAGESFKGTMEIIAGKDSDFTDFRFEGNNWRTVSVDVNTEVFMNKSDRLEIPFELQALDGAAEVAFKFEYGGGTVAKSLDLSLDHFNRMTRPGALITVVEGSEPIRGQEYTAMEPLAFKADDSAADRFDPEDQENAEKRAIIVSGYVIYERPDGMRLGADGVTVRIYDEDVIYDDLLGVGGTDPWGYFSFEIGTLASGETNPDIYLVVEAANNKVEVEDATWEFNYTWSTGVRQNFSGNAIDYGIVMPENESEHPALGICTNISRTWRWLFDHESYNTPTLDVQWPDGPTGALYHPFWGEIHLGDDAEWDEATHAHEYGHHWVVEFATRVDSDYCNGICDEDPDAWFFDECGHCVYCEETDHDAFSEGFPNFLGYVMRVVQTEQYGVAPLEMINFETIEPCQVSPYEWADPYLTEGHMAAVLRDIADSENDDDGHYPGYADVLTLGTHQIFDVVYIDRPTTPIGFLNAMKTRFPEIREDLWETAKNCGYGIDYLPPEAPTNMGSSHSTTSDSPDPTVRFTWDRSYDDASGIDGYGISVTSAPERPAAVKDIGDVTHYYSGTLAPGTYYFNLRPVDRALRWSSSYASYGPVTIRDAEPSDLTYHLSGPWDYPIVPRSDAAAVRTNTTVSATLNGNSNSTYWNFMGKNQGEASTSTDFQTHLYVDNEHRYSVIDGSVGHNVLVYQNNIGPFVVKGGRHTFEMRLDGTDAIAEVNEVNNFYAHQFVWTPWSMTKDVPMSRVTPPDMTGGWSSINDGQIKFYNCDGLAPTETGWWNAIVVVAVDNDDDYDVRLHYPSSGAEDGFTINYGFSNRAAGCIDAVLFNKNMPGSVAYQAGVLNWGQDVGSYRAEHVTSTSFAFGDSTDISFPLFRFLQLKEFYVSPADTGYVSITVEVDPAEGPLHVQWLDEYYNTGALSSNGASTTTDPVTGLARLDIHIGDPGYNCLVVYRDPKDNEAAVTATVEIGPTPPDFRPYFPVGWHAPIVPRPLADGIPSYVAIPDTLHGNLAETYLNFAVRNDSPGATSGLLARAYVDGVSYVGVGWGALPGYATRVFNWDGDWTIRGGRHTLDMRLDPMQTSEEIWESNNSYGEQYVWSPLNVGLGSQVSRDTPPDRTGGWNEISDGAIPWYNCDGLRIDDRAVWWEAMAVMPGPDTDVDVRLHTQAVGTKSGFGPNLAYSGWGPESSDFVVINYNLSSHIGYDAGVLALGGDNGYTADHAGSTLLGSDPAGATATFNIPAGTIVGLHEVNLSAGDFTVQLVDDGGGVDWGLSLMPPDAEFMGKSGAMASSWDGAAGENEELAGVTIGSPGYHCLVVWKANQDDLASSGSYHLVFGSGVSAVEDQTVPRTTALGNIYPNPFNPQTTIAFDLASAGRTEIAIYNLKGAVVRVLKSETLPAGRHEVIWNGTDRTGQRVASGVYMARLRTGQFTQMKKLMLVK